MRPTLDDLVLPQVQTLRVADSRALAEHRAPEMDGSYFQNLGRNPTVIALAGVASGPEALPFLRQLTTRFESGAPVSFVADIATDAELDRVLIAELRVREVAGKPERLAYAMLLHEFIEPETPEDVSGLDAELLEDATGLVDGLVEGLDLFPAFATGLERFVEPLGSLLSRLQEVNRAT
jgi:hypothetical protein